MLSGGRFDLDFVWLQPGNLGTMGISIGFILLTHEKPRQICRLIDRLNTMFDHPPIAWHHDFAKCALPIEDFTKNVSFVLPPLPTGWGIFAVVEAAIRGMRLMYEAPEAPDWFVLLSGSDYPIKPAARIREDLAASPYDAHIRHELIDPTHFERDWHLLCYKRYFFERIQLPRQRPSFIRRRYTPFSAQFQCYAGEFWFCANRRSAEHIIDFHATRPRLAEYYRPVIVPEESYFQCILANASHLRLSKDHFRYIDWTAGGSHPKILGAADLSQLGSSNAHFARKFDGDPMILDKLELLVGGSSSRT